jgi:hypothetical protein
MRMHTFYVCVIAPHKHKRTAYTAMRPHFITVQICRILF